MKIKPQRFYNSKLKGKARSLRKSQTDVERILWNRLRARQLEGLKFRRQFPIGHYVLDFYCPENKLAIELDGSQHMVSTVKDLKRTKLLSEMGITVIRFWNNDVINNIEGVGIKILDAIKK